MVCFSLLTIVAALSAPLTSAWGITFYSEPGCNNATGFNNVDYEGTGTDMNTCISAGSPGYNCIWWTNNVQNSWPCTAGMTPVGSFMLTQDGKCAIWMLSPCYESPGYQWFDANQGNHCYDISVLDVLLGYGEPEEFPYYWFTCQDT